MKTLIANGYIIDPSQGINTGGKNLLENGTLVGTCFNREARSEFPLSENRVCAGFLYVRSS